MSHILSFLFFCCCFSSIYSEVAICAIFRDEASYLNEWVEFHVKQGVSHFYLYNNLSQDDWQSHFCKWIDQGVVEIIDWPHESHGVNNWNNIQCSAYWDGIQKAKGHYEWLAILDTDEFLFSMNKNPLPRVLELFKDCPGVMVNWVCYGTSNVAFIPTGKRMLDHLVYRSRISHSMNKLFKTIVRPQKVNECFNPHFFTYVNDQLAVDENRVTMTFGKKLDEKNSSKLLRINHYWSRDLKFFHEQKIPRRFKWWANENIIGMERELNVIYDPILSELH